MFVRSRYSSTILRSCKTATSPRLNLWRNYGNRLSVSFRGQGFTLLRLTALLHRHSILKSPIFVSVPLLGSFETCYNHQDILHWCHSCGVFCSPVLCECSTTRCAVSSATLGFYCTLHVSFLLKYPSSACFISSSVEDG